MAGVGIVFLAVAIGVLAFLSIAVFFIIFGLMKKMKGFVIAGALGERINPENRAGYPVCGTDSHLGDWYIYDSHRFSSGRLVYL